jgi:D-xylose transport system ATP-binding protein
VRDLIRQLKKEGLGIILVSHDIHDVFYLSERISVMYHGPLVDSEKKDDVTTDEVLGMIILGKPPTKLTEQDVAALHP